MSGEEKRQHMQALMERMFEKRLPTAFKALPPRADDGLPPEGAVIEYETTPEKAPREDA